MSERFCNVKELWPVILFKKLHVNRYREGHWEGYDVFKT